MRGFGRVSLYVGGSRQLVAIDMIDNVDAFFGFNPGVVFGQSGVSADDGHDALRRWSDGGGVFENEVEDGAEIPGTFGVEAEGARVAVNGWPVEARIAVEFLGDVARTVPIDEELLDGFAVRMAADLAFAGVMVKFRRVAARDCGGVYGQRSRFGCGVLM